MRGLESVGAIVLGGAAVVLLVVVMNKAKAAGSAAAPATSAGSIDASALAAFMQNQGYFASPGSDQAPAGMSPADLLAAGMAPI